MVKEAAAREEVRVAEGMEAAARAAEVTGEAAREAVARVAEATEEVGSAAVNTVGVTERDRWFHRKSAFGIATRCRLFRGAEPRRASLCLMWRCSSPGGCAASTLISRTSSRATC